MSESVGGLSPLDDVKFFILILLGLGLLWYANGGYDRAKQNTASSTPEKTQEINVTVTTSTPNPTNTTTSPTPYPSDVYIIR